MLTPEPLPCAVSFAGSGFSFPAFSGLLPPFPAARRARSGPSPDALPYTRFAWYWFFPAAHPHSVRLVLVRPGFPSAPGSLGVRSSRLPLRVRFAWCWFFPAAPPRPLRLVSVPTFFRSSRPPSAPGSLGVGSSRLPLRAHSAWCPSVSAAPPHSVRLVSVQTFFRSSRPPSASGSFSAFFFRLQPSGSGFTTAGVPRGRNRVSSSGTRIRTWLGSTPIRPSPCGFWRR